MSWPRQASQRDVLAALSVARQGRIYDLSSGWWRGMPGIDLHPRFDVVTYRSPRGVRNQNDIPMLAPENNTVGYGFMSEMVLGTTHTGTHIDALCHITCGDKDEWHGGHSAEQELGDLGALNSDASEFPTFVSRGVCFDIPDLLGKTHLAPHTPVSAELLERFAMERNVAVRPGDVALIRTGQMSVWPDVVAMDEAAGGAGLALDGAQWLYQRGCRAVGGDTAFLEVDPSGIEGSPQPVHIYLLQQNGIPILEWVNCEELARDGVYEFLFLCLPLTIKGASGSMVRPLAIA